MERLGLNSLMRELLSYYVLAATQNFTEANLIVKSVSRAIYYLFHRARNPGKQLNKSRAENVSKALFSNQQKIQLHFYRAHACFVKYFLMTKKLQQTKKLAYVTTCGPSGRRDPYYSYE